MNDLTKNKKVLIVEDNATLSELLQNQIERDTISVIVARDGEEALQKMLSEKPDLIVLDIMIPKKDGITVLKEFHAKVPGNKTPIIILSNSTDLNQIANAADYNIVAYLIKSDQNLDAIENLIKEKLHLA